MPLLDNASTEQLRRLMDFFPSSTLKAEWPGLKGMKKESVCEQIAITRDIQRIKTFLMQNFSRCRQHILLLQKPELGTSGQIQLTLPDLMVVFPTNEQVGTMPGGIEFYIGSVPYKVYLLNPMEETTVDVLWPIRVERQDKIIIVSTVVLERDPANFSGRTSLKATREVDEKRISQQLNDLGFTPLDINKGVKALWSSKYMDAFRSSFKKAKSTSTEVMDGEIGLRENAPEVFDEAVGKPLFNTSFRTDGNIENSTGEFQINPTFGRIGFTSYTENLGDTDEIVKAILEANS